MTLITMTVNRTLEVELVQHAGVVIVYTRFADDRGNFCWSVLTPEEAEPIKGKSTALAINQFSSRPRAGWHKDYPARLVLFDKNFVENYAAVGQLDFYGYTNFDPKKFGEVPEKNMIPIFWAGGTHDMWHLDGTPVVVPIIANLLDRNYYLSQMAEAAALGGNLFVISEETFTRGNGMNQDFGIILTMEQFVELKKQNAGSHRRFDIAAELAGVELECFRRPEPDDDDAVDLYDDSCNKPW